MRLFARVHPRRLTAFVTVGLFLTSCMRWNAKPLTSSQFPPAAPDREARVILVHGMARTVRNPFIEHDSLLWPIGGPGSAAGALHEGIPLDQVLRVEVHEVDAAATAGLMITAVGVTAIIVAAAQSGKKSSPPASTTTCTQDCLGLASCPQVYSWDGRDWRLDSGTFGGAIMRALTRTDVDNLDYVRAERGVLRLKVTNEMQETDYLDAASVVAVDHDSGFSVAPDAQGGLHTIGSPLLPVAVRDLGGRDALSRVAALDGWTWESAPAIRDTSRAADLRDGLELTFLRPAGARTARLIVDANVTVWAASLMTAFIAAHGRATEAWYDSLAAAPARARQLGGALAQRAFLTASVWVDGQWRPQGLVWDAGPEVVKRQVVPLDLTALAGDTVRVRLESVPSFWLIDHVAIDYSAERPIAATELNAATATDARGSDVRALLGAIDGRPLTVESGDSAILTFRVPATPAGRVRSYLLRSTGWYHIHTPADREPDVALLDRILSDPAGIAKAGVARMNGALQALAPRAQ